MVGTETKRTKTRQMMKRRELKQEMCCEAFRQELSVYERKEPNRGEVTGRRYKGGGGELGEQTGEQSQQEGR